MSLKNLNANKLFKNVILSNIKYSTMQKSSDCFNYGKFLLIANL